MEPDRRAILKRRLLTAAAIVPAVIIVLTLALLLRSFTSGDGPRHAEGALKPGGGIDHRNLLARLEQARQHLNQNEPGQAQAILRDAIEADPEDQELQILYAESLLAQAKVREAYRHYEAAVAIGPDNPELRFAAGTTASMIRLDEQAEEHFWRAQQLAPSNPKHPLYLGHVQRRRGNTDDARASFLRAATLDPQLGHAWGSLAGIALDDNKLSVARTYISKARDAEPDSVLWRVIEAKILRRDNDPESALRLLSALDEDVVLSRADVLEEMGLCYGLLGRPSDAANLYAEAAAIDRENIGLHLEAAKWYERAGDADVAAVYASLAARLGSDEGEKMLARLMQDE
ncbi:MAG: tetratricopeptide repeat protein [Phycisphaeraceae bacterium]|nr:MAG: tetratricopeptide repeat protein [Phycisphaeraceae bacterium]